MQPSNDSQSSILGEGKKVPDGLAMQNLDLKARILSGENIPLEELRQFILTAEKGFNAERKRRNRAETEPKDVDFF